MGKKLFMITVLLTLLALGKATALAGVFIVAQLCDVEVSAGSDCPQDEPRPPDFGKLFTTDLSNLDEFRAATMSSTCGEATMTSNATVQIGASTISGSFGASSLLEQHGGGYANTSIHIALRVDLPTAYVLTVQGHTVETGDRHRGAGLVIALQQQLGTTIHESTGAENFDLRWEGILGPGFTYTLVLGASTQRDARALPGGEFLFMDGNTELSSTFQFSFENGAIVGIDDVSVGDFKARF